MQAECNVLRYCVMPDLGSVPRVSLVGLAVSSDSTQNATATYRANGHAIYGGVDDDCLALWLGRLGRGLSFVRGCP